MFIPSEGRKFIISDYSGIELVILASMSEDETLIDQILHGDIHSFVATSLYAKEIESVLGEPLTKSNRKIGKHRTVRDEFKRVSYAICYGSTGRNIYQTCRGNLASVGLYITEKEANNWIERWKHELFPKTGKLLQQNATSAVTRLYTSSVNGRKRFWPDTIRLSKSAFNAAMREGMNQPIQSTSADMTKTAMWNVNKSLDFSRAELLATIHDELLIEADNDYVEEACVVVKNAMESAGYELFPNLPKGMIVAEPKVSERYDK